MDKKMNKYKIDSRVQFKNIVAWVEILALNIIIMLALRNQKM